MSEVSLDFNLHPSQMEVFKDPARLKVVAAGRRFGKSHYATIECLIHGLQDYNTYGYDISQTSVYYIAPTFDQAKRAVWNKFLQELGGDVVKNYNKNEGIIYLINDREIHLKGADRPDTLRGAKLSFAVLDEFAWMKPNVWNQIIRPALLDVEGEALFIGTPDGKNHFYKIFQKAKQSREKDEVSGEKHPEWGYWTFATVDNPTIPASKEMEAAREDGVPEEIIRQEYEANFHASGGKVFSEDDIVWVSDERANELDGVHYVAVDPAGYADVGEAKSATDEKLDETAIAIVKSGTDGWLVEEIRHGRWDVRRTAVEIIKAARDYQALAVGIEQGSLKNAIMPYLDDKMRSLNTYLNIVGVTHGGRKKTERIAWSLQGRLENGKLFLRDSHDDNEWQRAFINQLLDFPNPLSHDDLLDALAYIDQVSVVSYGMEDELEDEFEILDESIGF